MVGYCQGSMSPTQSPSFQDLKVIGACPEEHSLGQGYEDGDMVAFKLSSSPLRTIVMKCKPFPYSGYCNQAGFEPGSEYSHFAWNTIGACEGSLAPSSAPVPYTGACTFNKCITREESCVCGASGCPTQDGQLSGCKREVKACSDVAVELYSSSRSYDHGDVVRMGLQRFKCRSYPNGLWCNNGAYAPALGAGIWANAWSKDGNCPTAGPTASPTTPFPTSSPSKSVCYVLVLLWKLLWYSIQKSLITSYQHSFLLHSPRAHPLHLPPHHRAKRYVSCSVFSLMMIP